MTDHKATAAQATSNDVADRPTPAWLAPLKWLDANLEKAVPYTHLTLPTKRIV